MTGTEIKSLNWRHRHYSFSFKRQTKKEYTIKSKKNHMTWSGTSWLAVSVSSQSPKTCRLGDLYTVLWTEQRCGVYFRVTDCPGRDLPLTCWDWLWGEKSLLTCNTSQKWTQHKENQCLQMRACTIGVHTRGLAVSVCVCVNNVGKNMQWVPSHDEGETYSQSRSKQHVFKEVVCI